MYDEIKTGVKPQDKVSRGFPNSTGQHQGTALSPDLLTLILDMLSELLPRIDVMLFIDDIVLVGYLREEINGKLEM
ncbi:hypothetical protein Lal_00016365 [Lupinus albus]|nr:hypothetical protein Lal_00016365 [Lupinus albus]